MTTITYDALNRPTLIDAPSGTMDIATTYDNLGRVLTTSGNGQTLIRTWDPLSNMTSEAGPLGTMGYQYDQANRMTRITWPDSFHVQYDRDTYGAVTAIRENSATSGPGLLAVYGYGDVGQLTGITRGNGTTTSYGYDAARRMTGMSHDLAGTAWDVVFGYAYNAAGQISARSTSNAAYVYAPVTGGTGYANNGRNQVTSIWGTPVTYDANQNVTSGLGQTYAHDAAGRLIGTSGSAYNHDPAGRMYAGSASGTFLSYAGAQLSGEHNASGTLLVRHIPGPGLDQPIVSYHGAGLATRKYLVQDERLSVINLSDGSGNTLNVNRYDEYGMPAPGNSDRFQYTGQAIIEPGLYNYRNRVYAPQFGRFLQTDPIGYGDGPNLYGYVGGDPMNRIDPWGLTQEAQAGDWVTHRRCSAIGGSVVKDGAGVEWCQLSAGGGIVGIGRSGGDGSGGGGGGNGGQTSSSPNPVLERVCRRDQSRSEATQGALGSHITESWVWNDRQALQYELDRFTRQAETSEILGIVETGAGIGTVTASWAVKLGAGGAAARTAAGPVVGTALLVAGIGAGVDAHFQRRRAEAVQYRLDALESCG